jgi:hypothetical protein
MQLVGGPIRPARGYAYTLMATSDAEAATLSKAFRFSLKQPTGLRILLEF